MRHSSSVDPHVKFYYTVRSCHFAANQFMDTLAPLRDQVNSNTDRMNELEEKVAKQGTVVGQDKEKAVTMIEDSETKIREDMIRELRAAAEEERDRVYRAKNVIVTGVVEPDTNDTQVDRDYDEAAEADLFTTKLKMETTDFTIVETTKLYPGCTNM